MGFRISWAVLRIPKPRIPDSTSKNDQDSRIRPIPLHGATFDFTNFIDTFLYHQLWRELGLLPRHYLTIWSQRHVNSFNRIMLSVSIRSATRSTWKIRIFRGVARIFQEGEWGFTLCHTQGTYQIGMLTSRRFFTKRDIFFRSAVGVGRRTSLQDSCID